MSRYCPFKGRGSPDEYFFEVLLSEHAQMVLKFSGCLVKEKNNYCVSDCFFDNSYYFSKDCSESCTIIFVPAFLCYH
jgi:hypothetical protein